MSVSTYPSNSQSDLTNDSTNDSINDSNVCSKTTLTELQRQYILLTQNGFPLISKPYDYLAQQLNISVQEVLTMTEMFLEQGIIRRIAAVPNHYKLGYKYNGMTVWDVEDSQASLFGDAIGKLPFVSHCYLRPRHLPQWNYNLFAMVHGKTPQEIEHYRDQIKELLVNVLQNRPNETDVLKFNSKTVNSDDVNNQSDDCQVQAIKQYKNDDMLISTKILKKTGLRLKNKESSTTQ